MSFIQEFKEFALKGNVVDMAVGIIIGVAFNAVVNSLVNDVIMPPIGLLIGGVDFTRLQVVLKPAGVNAQGKPVPAVVIHYGMFINRVIEFLIIALTVFVVIKFMNRILRQRQAMTDQPDT